MIAEFQVFYKAAAGPEAAIQIESILIRAERENQALEIAKSLGVIPISVGPGRTILDPHQQWFDRTEAGAYSGCGPSAIDQLMAKGLLPKSKDGRPLFPRRILDALLEKRMGLAQWEAE